MKSLLATALSLVLASSIALGGIGPGDSQDSLMVKPSNGYWRLKDDTDSKRNMTVEIDGDTMKSSFGDFSWVSPPVPGYFQHDEVALAIRFDNATQGSAIANIDTPEESAYSFTYASVP